MTNSGTTPYVANLDISDADTEDLFASPSKIDKKSDPKSDLKTPNSDGAPTKARNGESSFDTEEAREAREAALRKELDGVRGINEVIEGVVQSLERAKGNMDTVSRTVNSASTLLNSWMRILSQTEHNQRLILDSSWQGASQDILDVENENVLRQQAAERREIEEQHRREAAARKAEDDEKRRAEGSTSSASRGSKMRGRSVGRGLPSVGSNYAGVGGQGGTRGTSRGASNSGRGSSGVGRGRTSTRGRGRGTL